MRDPAIRFKGLLLAGAALAGCRQAPETVVNAPAANATATDDMGEIEADEAIRDTGANLAEPADDTWERHASPPRRAQPPDPPMPPPPPRGR